jgi:hypothetical protein
MWYEWETLEDFNLWHIAKCLELGYPEISEDGSILTSAYTQAYQVQSKVIAYVDIEHAQDLTETNLRLPPYEEA